MIHHGIFPSGRSPGHSFSGCSRLGPIPPMRLCPKSATTLHISGLSEVAGKYEAVLLDQFGVLHDGRKAYSQRTLEAVRALSDMGIKVFIISNSSRRSSGTLAKLQKLGFDAKWFVGAVTSGDMTHLHLEQRPSPWWQALGNRCIHFTWSTRGAISLGMGLEVKPTGQYVSMLSLFPNPLSQRPSPFLPSQSDHYISQQQNNLYLMDSGIELVHPTLSGNNRSLRGGLPPGSRDRGLREAPRPRRRGFSGRHAQRPETECGEGAADDRG